MNKYSREDAETQRRKSGKLASLRLCERLFITFVKIAISRKDAETQRRKSGKLCAFESLRDNLLLLSKLQFLAKTQRRKEGNLENFAPLRLCERLFITFVKNIFVR